MKKLLLALALSVLFLFLFSASLTLHTANGDEIIELNEIESITIIKDNMIFVEGGTFVMGDHFNEGIDNEIPLHNVTLSSFYISKTEITQTEWEAVNDNNPSNYPGENNPVEKVSWFDAVEYCNALSILENLTPCYTGTGNTITCDFTANGYRLPTEAEWEFAARGGIHSIDNFRYSGCNEEFELTNFGWYYSNNSVFGTKEVGLKLPNQLFIYDMSGNVWEWCWDWYGSYTAEAQFNPTGPETGSYRIRKGGDFNDTANHVRVAVRSLTHPSLNSDRIGFRIVRTSN